MSQTTVPNSPGVKSYAGSKEQQKEIRKCLISNTDVLADFIRRFGIELIQHCRYNYNVNIVLSENDVLVEGFNAANIELCKQHIKQYMKERCLLIPIPAYRFPLAHDKIRKVSEQYNCVLKMNSLGASVPDRHLLRWLNPYGSLEFCLKESGGFVKTDILVVLTDDKFNPLCCLDDIDRFWITQPVQSASLGSSYSHKVNKALMCDTTCCKEVWSVVCLHTDQNTQFDLINSSLLLQAFQKMFQNALNMNLSEICVFASPVDKVRSELQIFEIVQMLVQAAEPVHQQNPAQRLSVEVIARKQDIEKAHNAIDFEFQKSYRVFEKFPKQTSSKGKSIRITSTLRNIQSAKADVIVNTTTSSLAFNGKCATDIKEAAGEKVEEECKKRFPNGIPECSVVYTQSYKLKSRGVKYVFHTALPKYKTYNETQIKEVVKKCLYLAEELDCKSIAIPAIGVGGLGFPRRESAFYTYEAIKEYGIENQQTKLCKIKIMLFSGDKATCKAFANEEFRRRPTCPVQPSAPVRYGDPIFQRFLEHRKRTCVRIKLLPAATYPAYAVQILFTSGKNLIVKDATTDPKSWNDSIEVPIQFDSDVRAALEIVLSTERITHLIWNLDTNCHIPYSHQVDTIIRKLEEMADSEYLQCLRIVDVVVSESMLDELKADLKDWELTYETEEPTYFLELIAESRESLKRVKRIVSSMVHENCKKQTIGQMYAMSSKPLASSKDILGQDQSKHISDKTAYKETNQAYLSSSLKENKPVPEYDPLYDEIDDSNDLSANELSTENSDETDNGHTYERLANVRAPTSDTAQTYTLGQNVILPDSIEKRETPIPMVSLVEAPVCVEQSTFGTPVTPPQNSKSKNFEVSACINTGIINYLAEQNLLEEWITSVQNRFKVDICRNKAGYTVSGSLDDLIQFEHHLENGLSDLTVEEDYFSSDDSLKVPMNEMRYHYICILRNKNFISSPVLSMKYATGCLEAKGLQTDLHNLKCDIKKFLSLAEQETVSFNTDTEAKCALDKHIHKFADISMTQNNNEIQIFGSSEIVAKALKSLSPILSLRKTFKIPISNLNFVVLQGDIRNVVAEFIAVSSTATMSKQVGAGKHISDMLGQNYIEECRLSIKNDYDLQHGKCRVIKSGLSVRKWIGNVWLPTYTESRTHQELEHVLMEAYYNCFFAANQKQCRTMAMTCIGSDESRGGFPLKECINYLCQSLQSFKPTHLQEILLVENNEKKVLEIIKMIESRTKK